MDGGAAQTARKKGTAERTSCTACFRRKVRCVRTDDQNACDACLRRGERCSRLLDSPLSRRKWERMQRERKQQEHHRSPVADLARNASESTELQAHSPEREQSAAQRVCTATKSTSSSVLKTMKLLAEATGGLRLDVTATGGDETTTKEPKPQFPKVVSLGQVQPPVSLFEFLAVPRPIPCANSAVTANSSDWATSDLLLAGLAGFWENASQWMCLIHKETFEDAFRLRFCPIYGGQPTALLFALAALGMRFVELPDLSDYDRQVNARNFAQTAKELVLAGFFGKSRPPSPAGSGLPPLPAPDSMSMMEVCQTIVILFQFCVASGSAIKGFVMLQGLLDVVLELCMKPGRDGLTFRGTNWEPSNPIEWVYDDSRKRLWIGYLGMDLGFSSWAGRQPLFPYFSIPMLLPTHEFFFYSVPAERAFFYLYQHELHEERAQWKRPVPFSKLLESKSDPVELNALFVDLLDPIFQYRRTVITFTLFALFLRFVRGQMHDIVRRFSIDTYRLACKIGPDGELEELDSGERVYFDRVRHFSDLLRGFISSLPEPLSVAMTEGSTDALFRTAEDVFVDPTYAHSFLLASLSMLSTSVGNWVDESMPLSGELSKDGDPDLPGRVFASAPFLDVLKTAISFTRMLERQLLDDPELCANHYAVLPGTMRIGALHLAAYKYAKQKRAEQVLLAKLSGQQCPREQSPLLADLEHDIKVVALHLSIMGKRFPPWGEQFRKIFHKMMLAAGVIPFPAGLPFNQRAIVIEQDEIDAVRLRRDLDIGEQG